MFVLLHREEIELRLRAELEEAEHKLRDATPEELIHAKRHYCQLLHTFTRLIVDGILPEEYRWARLMPSSPSL